MAQSTIEAQAMNVPASRSTGAIGAVSYVAVKRGPTDAILLLSVACLVSIGLTVIYNVTAIRGHAEVGNDAYYFGKQAFGALIGTIGLTVASRIDFRFYQRHIGKLMFAGLFLLALTAIPGIGVTHNGATRWINIGFEYQPAELVKIISVIYLAHSIAKRGEHLRNFFDSFIAHALVFLVYILLLMKQPDFGSSAMICAMIGIMLFVGGARIMYMAGFAALGAVSVIWAITSREYRMDRVRAWLDPWLDPQDTGFQLVNSFLAFAEGGATGTGLGHGAGRLGYVPELQNDFIGAAIAEEFGLLGIVAICLLYIVFLWRGMRIAAGTKDQFGKNLAFGLTTLISMQAMMNLCVVTGILPTKGLTLPFVSSGLSSLVLLLGTTGILLNIAQDNPDIYEERRVAREQMAKRGRHVEKADEVLERRTTEKSRALGHG